MRTIEKNGYVLTYDFRDGKDVIISAEVHGRKVTVGDTVVSNGGASANSRKDESGIVEEIIAPF
ncbi:MAG: hypothetical protein Q8R20_00890, partial [Nanoarchaeota archaeon]|nr:hypothetical protein [Nanoarchaeota archaeon]